MGDDVTRAKLAEDLLKRVPGATDVDHYRLLDVVSRFDGPAKRHDVVGSDDRLAEADLDPDDAVGKVAGGLHRRLYARPPDVFQLADVPVQLAHP